MEPFDLVRIKRTDNVNYLSGPKNYSITPNGNWIVVGNIGNNVLVTKDQTLISIPSNDLFVVGIYSLNLVLDNISNIGLHKIDMIKYMNETFEWDEGKTKLIFNKYNIPKFATNVNNRDELVSLVNKFINENGDEPWV